jgi:hypothetical protein
LTAPSETKNIGDKFNVTIDVDDLSFIFSWQIKLFFNPAYINCTDATYPSGHIFAGHSTVPVEPTMDNTLGYVTFGSSLLGDDYVNVTGLGVLCNVEFKAVAVGSSQLNFSTPYGEDTFVWDKDLNTIDLTVVNGSVSVVPEFNLPMLLLTLMSAGAIAAVVTRKVVLRKTN